MYNAPLHQADNFMNSKLKMELSGKSSHILKKIYPVP